MEGGEHDTTKGLRVEEDTCPHLLLFTRKGWKGQGTAHSTCFSQEMKIGDGW